MVKLLKSTKFFFLTNVLHYITKTIENNKKLEEERTKKKTQKPEVEVSIKEAAEKKLNYMGYEENYDSTTYINRFPKSATEFASAALSQVTVTLTVTFLFA